MAVDRGVLEKRVLELGQSLLARTKDSGSMFEGSGPLGKAMSWVMDDPKFKVDMFRLVDVMPMLQTPAEVAEHLTAYLGTRDLATRGWMSKGLGWLAGNSLTAGLTARAVQSNVAQMAHIFIAGATAADALKILAKRRKENIGFTLDLLGEAAVASDEAVVYQQRYLELMESLASAKGVADPHPILTQDDRGPIPAINISVKLSALFPFCDPLNFDGTKKSIAEKLAPILRRAMQSGFFVNLDMEFFQLKDLTLSLFEDLMLAPEFKTYPHFGIALQAYLRSGPGDLARMIALAKKRGAPLTVRLVKGAYWDYENIVSAQQHWALPVFADKASTDATYEVMTEAMLENRAWIKPAFGSHNIRSISHAIAYAQALKIPANAYEFQMLYGMADSIKKALAQDGFRIREYVPIGEVLPGMAYLVRRLLENTSNESFLRHQYQDKAPLEALLKAPQLSGQAAGVAGTEKTAAGAAGASLPIDHRLERPFENEPVLNFALAEERAAYATALQAVRAQFGKRYPLLIEGKPVDTALEIKSINPSNPAEVVGVSACAGVAEAGLAVAIAEEAAAEWAARPWAERAGLLLKTADRLRARHHELAAWATFECSKPWREASGDVAEAIDFCEYYARAGYAMRLPKRVSFMPGEDSIYGYQPKGPAVVISPWNFPLAIPCGMIAAALVTGNPVVFKPAEQATVCGRLLVDAFHEAGIPGKVLSYCPGLGEEIGPVLVEHPAVHTIAFTGSMQVGLAIVRAATKDVPGQHHVKRVIAEMGGKNAIIIDDDADLDEAVVGVVQSAFGYAGQKCSACSRVIVIGETGARFVQRLAGRIADLAVAPAEEACCDVPAVIDRDAHERLMGVIQAASQSASTLKVAGLRKVSSAGYFVPPVVITGVQSQDKLAQDELFGPVLVVIQAQNFEEALEIANGTKFALTGGVYTRHPRHLALARERFKVGNLYINRPITGALVGRQPFGGFGLSGVGSKAGGPDYLLQFVNPFTITENTMRRGFAPETVGLQKDLSDGTKK